MSLAGVDGWAMRLLPAISCTGTAASGVVSVMQGAELAMIHSSVQQAAALVPDDGALMLLVDRAFGRCPVLWIAPAKRLSAWVLLLSVSFILLLAGELIGRGVFLWFAYDRGMAVAS
ncbi:DmsC/YnfH family molybdoenzyme membrane anchor subunit [Shigella boydii]